MPLRIKRVKLTAMDETFIAHTTGLQEAWKAWVATLATYRGMPSLSEHRSVAYAAIELWTVMEHNN